MTPQTKHKIGGGGIRLPPKVEEVAKLRKQGMTYSEIAKRLGIKKSTVKKYLYLANKRWVPIEYINNELEALEHKLTMLRLLLSDIMGIVIADYVRHLDDYGKLLKLAKKYYEIMFWLGGTLTSWYFAEKYEYAPLTTRYAVGCIYIGTKEVECGFIECKERKVMLTAEAAKERLPQIKSALVKAMAKLPRILEEEVLKVHPTCAKNAQEHYRELVEMIKDDYS